ncbi:unnamed protein product [Prorocentrum cordatum]|uniref:Uncharacterized protein n=1 Tax=Prorocentrum cordatum TaxID=2364126 RepID=A0ABN9QMV6_9DINO|nr:unnamed protein product [Polarella glacialis]
MTTPDLLTTVGFEKGKIGAPRSGEKEVGYQIKESSLSSLVGSLLICFLVMGLMVVCMVYDVRLEKKTFHRERRVEEHHAASKLAQVQMELWSQYRDDVQESREATRLMATLNASYTQFKPKLEVAVNDVAKDMGLNTDRASKFADKILHVVADMQKGSPQRRPAPAAAGSWRGGCGSGGGAANASLAPATTPWAEAVAAAVLERLPLAGPAAPPSAAPPPEAGPALGTERPAIALLAWGLAAGELVILVGCCTAARVPCHAGSTAASATGFDGADIGRHRYPEDVSGSIGDGCSQAFACARDGTAPAVTRGSFYRCSEPVALQRFRGLVVTSRSDQSLRAAGGAFADLVEIFGWGGTSRPSAELRRRLPLRVAEAAVGGKAAPSGAAPLDPGAGEDARALRAQRDGRGERRKPRREIAREVTRRARKDCPLEGGLSTVEDIAEMWGRSGAGPLPDRTCVGAKRLLSVIHCAGGHDLSGLVSAARVELPRRRVSQIAEACSGDPTKLPERGGLRRYAGVTGPTGAIDPAPRTAVFSRN